MSVCYAFYMCPSISIPVRAALANCEKNHKYLFIDVGNDDGCSNCGGSSSMKRQICVFQKFPFHKNAYDLETIDPRVL